MINSVVLMGRLTADPEIKIINDDTKLARFCLAVERNRSTTDEKHTDFIDCIGWRNVAEFLEKYFKKGNPIIIEGKLETRQYEDKQGNKRKAFEVNVKNINFCSFKKGSDPEEKQTEPSESEPSKKTQQNTLEEQDLPF